jgi:hypothetical protein
MPRGLLSPPRTMDKKPSMRTKPARRSISRSSICKCPTKSAPMLVSPPCSLPDSPVSFTFQDGIEAAFEIRQYEKERNLPSCRIVSRSTCPPVRITGLTFSNTMQVVLSGLSNEVDMEKSGVLTGKGP